MMHVGRCLNITKLYSYSYCMVTGSIFLQTNTFQSVLTTDGTYSFVSFLYANGLIQWTTGEASGGIDGLGGSPAQCGFDAGDQTRFFAHPASGTAAIINIALTTNINIFGLWSFRVDGGNIAQPGTLSIKLLCNSFLYLLHLLLVFFI